MSADRQTDREAYTSGEGERLDTGRDRGEGRETDRQKDRGRETETVTERVRARDRAYSQLECVLYQDQVFCWCSLSALYHPLL